MSEGEKWVPVAGTDGRYEVSNRGRVRSMPRMETDKIGRIRPIRGRILAQATRPTGHKSVGMRQDGVARTRLVHQLVLEAFSGEPRNGRVTRHLDGNPANNVPANLVWGTQQENIQDKFTHETTRWALKRGGCVKGHPWPAENIRFQSNGSPLCRICKVDQQRRSRKAAKK